MRITYHLHGFFLPIYIIKSKQILYNKMILIAIFMEFYYYITSVINSRIIKKIIQII